MIFRFASINRNTITNNDKGHIFENFVKLLLETSGYENIQLNRKKNSLEYDILAQQSLDYKEKIVGEAKALNKKINGNIITSFIGKMVPYWDENENTLGLLVSISSLTPDAEDYLASIAKTRRINTVIGEEIVEKIARKSSYVSPKQIKHKAKKNKNVKLSDLFFIMTQKGYFYAQLMIPQNEIVPRFFELYSFDNGDKIEDSSFIRIIQNQIDELKTLKYYKDESAIEEKIHDKGLAINIPYTPTVEGGAGWFDYRLPAAPEFFIGREQKIEQFKNFLEEYVKNKTNTSIIEVLSKSGVGKSSFLLKAQSITQNMGWFSPIVDARDITNLMSILRITSYFVNLFNEQFNAELVNPSTVFECYQTLTKIDRILANHEKFGIIYLDQFEGLYTRGKNFDPIFDFFYELSKRCKRIVLCIGRKSDYLTTFEESVDIDFEKLYKQSYKISLPDFVKDEANILINMIGKELGERVVKELRSAILELSNGFPWLHKRICNHVVNLSNSGMSQNDIIEDGLQLEELFNNELENLDELDKEFLRELVQYLPDSIFNLQERFGDTSLFQKRIQKLSNLRLIRLTGETYDTYNDFFKEYIKTGKIPIRKRYILRQYPQPIINLVKKIYEHNYSSAVEIADKENANLKSIYNNMRDIKKLGFIETVNGRIIKKIDKELLLNEEELNQYIKAQLLDNKAITDVIHKLNEIENYEENILPTIIDSLKKSFPFLEISDKTWKTYSRILIAWISRTMSDSIQIDELNFHFKKRKKNNIIFPSATPNRSLKMLKRIEEKKTAPMSELVEKKGEDKIVTTLKQLGLVRDGLTGYLLTQKGSEFLSGDKKTRQKIIRTILMSYENVNNFLILLKFNERVNPYTLFSNLVDDLCFTKKWTEETKRWYFKNFKSWLVFSGLVIKIGKRSKKIIHPRNHPSLDRYFFNN